MTNNFRTVALALRDYVTNTYGLLEAADGVLAALGLPAESGAPTITENERLDALALNSTVVMFEIFSKRKINAIKELRAVSGCGLKEAKESVERIEVSHGSLILAARDYGDHRFDEGRGY